MSAPTQPPQPQPFSPPERDVTEKPTETQNEGSPGKRILRQLPIPEKVPLLKTALVVLVIIAAGIGTGYVLSNATGAGGGLKSPQEIQDEGVGVGDVFGHPDKETFRDEAEGILVKGGIDGEGSHHLMRPGGESQNVYLTSSVVDLEEFIDHRVRIWGETFAAQKAGWLMDVGRVEVLELNAEKPSESP